jgi:hypothetical protein
MKVRKNSLHAKLYKFTYDSKLPNNLCPYFWKLVFAFVVFIPNFIIQLPVLITKVFGYEKLDNVYNRCTGFCIYLSLLIVYRILITNYHAFKEMIHCYSYDSSLATFGIIIDIIILFILFIVGLVKIYKYFKNKKRYLENNNENIITEFIKAKYNKYCPKLDWNENE